MCELVLFGWESDVLGGNFDECGSRKSCLDIEVDESAYVRSDEGCRESILEDEVKSGYESGK